MNTLENVQHDLSDARFSVETAIELLAALGQERTSHSQALDALIHMLNGVRGDLDEVNQYLDAVQRHGGN